MKKINSFIAITVFCVGSFFLFQNCFFGGAKFQNTLNLALENEVTNLDPALAFNDEVLMAIGQSYEPLLQYHYLKRPYEIIPLLAEEMPQVINGGKSLLIKIKKGIPYHTHPSFGGKTRYVCAQDFLNQIKRLAFKPLKSSGGWVFENKLIGFDEFSKRVGDSEAKFYADTIAGVKVIDEHTLRLDLKKPDTVFNNFLTLTFVVPLPIEVIQYEKNNLKDVIVGTGPFEFVQKQENRFIFKKFEHYRKDYYPTVGDRYANVEDLISSGKQEIPFLDKITFEVIDNPDLRIAKYKNRELDLVTVPKEHLDKFTNQAKSELKEVGGELKHFPSLSVDWLSFNMRDPILGKNLWLRKAVAYAINYDQYLSIISNGTNRRANSIYNPGIFGYSPSHNFPYRYDLKLAKDYLVKAGYPNGEGLPPIKFSTRSNAGVHLNTATFFKDQLAAIGIKVEIEILSFTEFLKMSRDGQLQLFLDRWIYDYPDAENLIQLLLAKNHPGINKNGYSNKEIDKLYEVFVTTSNEDKKVAAMNKIEEIVVEELPWIMLSYYSNYTLHHSHVKNFRKSSFIRNFLKYIRIQN
ncbi:MAG: hypothetical protein JNM93_08315 [Bacteriovoracaceae bacterium]|nr:hypothetical protein [Bacteriovoracaceae bacterium]